MPFPVLPRPLRWNAPPFAWGLTCGLLCSFALLAQARDLPENQHQKRILFDEIEEPDDVRAGCPRCVAWWAVPSRSPRETGYFVGGGVPFRGEPRRADEGTWGWDFYLGRLPPHVRLKWGRESGPREEHGAYSTER